MSLRIDLQTWSKIVYLSKYNNRGRVLRRLVSEKQGMRPPLPIYT
jgi:hypothetical protein